MISVNKQRANSGTNSKQEAQKALRSIPVADPTTLNITQHAQDCALTKTTGVHTRSGRLSKPPSVNKQQQHAIVTKTFHAEEEDKENPGAKKIEVSGTVRRKAIIQPQHRCGTCHKIFLGRRMTRHLRQNPTHVTVDKLENCPTQTTYPKSVTTPSVALSSSPMTTESVSESSRLPEPQLFRLLVQLVTAAETESQQREVLLTEISQFVGLVRSLVPSLIVPSEREDNDTVYVDQNVADVLQLNRGKYRIRMDVFRSETVQSEKISITEDVSTLSDVGKNVSAPAVLAEEIIEKEKDSESANDSFAILPRIKRTSSMEAIMSDIFGLDDLQKQGRLPPLPSHITNHLTALDHRAPSPVVLPDPNSNVFMEPVASSSQSTTAFGRPCRLAEELFPSQSQLHALEELTNLSELCSPQMLGVPGGALPNESSVLNFD